MAYQSHPNAFQTSINRCMHIAHTVRLCVVWVLTADYWRENVNILFFSSFFSITIHSSAERHLRRKCILRLKLAVFHYFYFYWVFYYISFNVWTHLFIDSAPNMNRSMCKQFSVYKIEIQFHVYVFSTHSYIER